MGNFSPPEVGGVCEGRYKIRRLLQVKPFEFALFEVEDKALVVEHYVWFSDPFCPKSGFPLRRFRSVKRTGQDVRQIACKEVPDFCSSRIMVLSCPNHWANDLNNLLVTREITVLVTPPRGSWPNKH